MAYSLFTLLEKLKKRLSKQRLLCRVPGATTHSQRMMNFDVTKNMRNVTDKDSERPVNVLTL